MDDALQTFHIRTCVLMRLVAGSAHDNTLRVDAVRLPSHGVSQPWHPGAIDGQPGTAESSALGRRGTWSERK
jgi:hypothetical protein